MHASQSLNGQAWLSTFVFVDVNTCELYHIPEAWDSDLFSIIEMSHLAKMQKNLHVGLLPKNISHMFQTQANS